MSYIIEITGLYPHLYEETFSPSVECKQKNNSFFVFSSLSEAEDKYFMLTGHHWSDCLSDWLKFAYPVYAAEIFN